MAYSDDHIALAAEYALGTLDADERALVETMMIVDHGFKEMVEAWSFKLAPLHQMVAPVEPPADVWDRIKTSGDFSRPRPVVAVEPSAPIPEMTPAPERTSGVSHALAAPVASSPPVQDDKPIQPDEIRKEAHPSVSVDSGYAEELAATVAASSAETRLPEHVEPAPFRRASTPHGRGGYSFGLAMTAVAAALASLVALQLYRPDLLPELLRVKPKVQIVEVPGAPAPKSAQWIAALQQNAAEPAFILTVDPSNRSFTVRRVGVAPSPGKSYELWIVSDKLQRPRSLGVIADAGFTTSGALADYDLDMISRAVYAITLEQQGGSNGAPTANPIYAGKLFESAPGQGAR